MSRALTILEAEEKIKKHFGDTIKMSNYKMGDLEADFECLVCGYKWSTLAANVLRGRGCRNCYINRKIISLEEVKQRLFDKHGNEISILEYKSIKEDGKFKCNICGHEWNAQVSSVTDGGCGCPKCGRIKQADKRKLTVEEVRSFLEEQGCKLISDEYINNSTDIIVEFQCGHQQIIKLVNFQKGESCKKCSKRIMGDKFKTPDNEIIKLLEEHGLTFIDFPNGHSNDKSKIRFMCKFNHITTRDIATLKNKSQECKECSKIRRRQEYRRERVHNWKGGITALRPYLSNQLKEWKKKSLEASNYLCSICGKNYKDLEVHHLVTFSRILNETIKELNFQLKDTIGDYSGDEIDKLVAKLKEIHDRYPLGVAIRAVYHRKFHSLYGTDGQTTPEQWYEFVDLYKSGQIQIN